MRTASIKHMFVAFILLGSIACTNLDETIYDQIPQNDLGKTEASIQALVAPIYRTLRNIFPGDMFTLNECTSDMAITPTRAGGDWWDGGQFLALRTHTWTPRTSLITGTYKRCMEGVATCNNIYNVIEALPESEVKKASLAEIRGVRAFWFYMIVDMFGQAPLVTDFKNTDLPVQKSRKEIYDFVISELNAIKQDLPSDVNAVTYGRFTKGAAFTVLAKMYINAEQWTGSAQWQKTVDACDSVMKLAYIIEPTWKTNFTADNEKSREAILSAVFREGESGNHINKRTLHYLAPIALGIGEGMWNGISALPTYVRQFDSINDQRYAGSFLLGPLRDPKTGDTLVTAHNRLLIHTVDILPNGDKSWGDTYQESGARCNKWEFKAGTQGDMGNDFAIFRLADVYLMKAEALVRMGKDNAEATNLVNTIRKRAFVDDPFLKTSVDLNDIYSERRFELAWECLTRQDQIRFETFLLPSFFKPAASSATRLLYPIPQEAIDANKNLKQNPGY